MSARFPTFEEITLPELRDRLAHYQRIVEAPGFSKETVRRLRSTIARLEIVIEERETGVKA